MCFGKALRELSAHSNLRMPLLYALILGITFANFNSHAEDSLIPANPQDRVGPGIAALFENKGTPPDYEATRNHLHVGFRWQPYPDQPKNSEADIERELGKVASYSTFWYMSLHTLPSKKKPGLSQPSIQGSPGDPPCSQTKQRAGD